MKERFALNCTKYFTSNWLTPTLAQNTIVLGKREREGEGSNVLCLLGLLFLKNGGIGYLSSAAPSPLNTFLLKTFQLLHVWLRVFQCGSQCRLPAVFNRFVSTDRNETKRVRDSLLFSEYIINILFSNAEKCNKLSAFFAQKQALKKRHLCFNQTYFEKS